MRLPATVRMVLILVPLTTTASRLHAHRVDAPDVATQEVNRCLRLVKIAASRRETQREGDTAFDRRGVAGHRDRRFGPRPRRA